MTCVQSGLHELQHWPGARLQLWPAGQMRRNAEQRTVVQWGAGGGGATGLQVAQHWPGAVLHD
jgi:hypothetical protein